MRIKFPALVWTTPQFIWPHGWPRRLLSLSSDCQSNSPAAFFFFFFFYRAETVIVALYISTLTVTVTVWAHLQELRRWRWWTRGGRLWSLNVSSSQASCVLETDSACFVAFAYYIHFWCLFFGGNSTCCRLYASLWQASPTALTRGKENESSEPSFWLHVYFSNKPTKWTKWQSCQMFHLFVDSSSRSKDVHISVSSRPAVISSSAWHRGELVH